MVEPEDIVTTNTDEIVCPTCGYYFYNSDTYEEDEGDAYCPSCSREFKYRRNTFVTYDSYID